MRSILELSKEINKTNHEKGFWDSGLEGKVPEKLMLIVSELAEAMEADRKDNYINNEGLDGFYVISKDLSDEEFSPIFEDAIKDNYQDELADVAIRLFDLAFEQGIDLQKHIELKMRYNSTREHMHGGKKY